MLLNALATLPVLIWLYLALARGGFWRVRRHLRRDAPAPQPARIVAVVPARDEAAGIAQAITSLLDQRLTPPLEVIVVDDGSSDGTAALARGAAERLGKAERLTVLTGKPLPSGWTGKLWALSQGVDCAKTLAPDYLLFTDADIEHCPASIAQLLATAQAGGYDLASYMVKLAAVSLAEQALIPAFVYFFFALYPPAWIASRRHSVAGAAGGCILIRAAVLEQIGGIASIRAEVIDDCALARQTKRAGGTIWLGLTNESFSNRSYGSLREIGNMIARTAFNQLGHSALLLAATIVALFITYLLPVLLLFASPLVPRILGLSAWLFMSFTFLPTIRFYRVPAYWALALPVIALFYAGATIYSAWLYWRGTGGQWKGRIQDLRRS